MIASANRDFRRRAPGLARISAALALAHRLRPGSRPLVAARRSASAALTPTQWSANVAQQLLQRHGIVMRETAIAENIPGGYNTIYPALKTMEDSGWVRRGMFVAGLGAAQFAMPAAVDMLRSLRTEPSTPEALFLAATDPANLYGPVLAWPRRDGDSPTGASPAHAGRWPRFHVAYQRSRRNSDQRKSYRLFRRKNPDLQVFLPDSEPERTHFARQLAKKLAEVAIRRQGRKSGLLIGTVNHAPAREHFLARFLEESGFVNTSLGFQMRRVSQIALPNEEQTSDEGDLETDDNDSEATESA